MSTFSLSQYGGVPVTLSPGLTQDQLLNFKPFTRWLNRLTASLAEQRSSPFHPFHANPYVLKSITVQAHDVFGHDRVGFLKLTADVSTASSGESLPAATFLRGPSVALLVILTPEDASPDERFVVLTVQPRVPTGSLEMVELPAGMVDDQGSFKGAVAGEMKEELGLEVSDDEMVCLSDLVGDCSGVEPDEHDEGLGLPEGVFPSAGGCDEYLRIFLHERTVKRETLDEWNGKLTGLREEGEKITLKLVRLRDLWKEGRRDAKCLSALAFYDALKREGRI